MVPPSRPMTPSEQINIMLDIEAEEIQRHGLPSERDVEVSICLMRNLKETLEHQEISIVT